MDKKAKEIILNYITACLPKITVTSGLCRYNYMCHMNSVHDAINNNQEFIAMCFYIDGGYPIIHFINVDGDAYIDNTLGIWSTNYEYYLIRLINKNSFFDIQNIFKMYRKELRNKLPFYIKWFTNIQF